MDSTQLVDAWAICARINLFFLAELSDEQWKAKAAKGRSVCAQFCHLHNVRLMWLKSEAPDLLEGLEKLEDADKATASEALAQSAKAIAVMIERAVASDGRIKGFKPHVGAFVGYIISHESHHRGMAELSLRLVGLPISDKTSFGLWEWGVR